MAQSSDRAPRSRRLPRAFWGGVAGATATAVAVEVTRTGLDVLVLVVVGLIIVLIERTVGDWLGELLGAGLATIVLGTCLAAVAWVVFEEGGIADRLFSAAEQRGYHTSYYESTKPPPTASAPMVAVASTTGASPGPSPSGSSRARSGGSLPSAAGGVPAGQAPPESAGADDSSATAWLLGPSLPNSLLILSVPTPSMTRERIQIRARLTSDGRPVVDVPIEFTVNARSISIATTNREGIAAATFSASIAGRYLINAQFRNDGRLTQSSASALLIVLQGSR